MWTVFGGTLVLSRERPDFRREAPLPVEEERSLRTALLTLILPGSQMLDELSRDKTNTGQQKRVNETALMHHKLQDKPDDEKK
jgi:hypothetical protein